jgi:hypothetical protein
MKLASALRRVRGRRTGTLFAPAGAGRSDGTRILFIRDLISFHGGHIKAWDYFNHVLATEGFVPYIWFTSRSVFDDRNPWTASDLERCDEWVRPDFFFVGGGDWIHVDALGGGRVINLIQHVRHANEGSDRFRLLSRPALRICVSPEVADAIGATGQVNGPVVTISNGIDVAAVERSASNDRSNLLVVANKQPELGRRLAQELDADRLIDGLVPRQELLDAMGHARVTLFVPNPTEGFYLPALEGMAAGTIVVCPDVVGNRSFCVPDTTALRPAYEEAAMIDAARRALAMTDPEAMLAAAKQMAQAHDIARERSEFQNVLRRADDLVPGA